MSGKKTIFLFICFHIMIARQVLTISTDSLSKEVYVRGGLVFEKPLPQAVMVNPQVVTFSRALDLSPFLEASKEISLMTKRYIQFCDIIKAMTPTLTDKTSRAYNFKIHVSTKWMRDSEAIPYCKKLGGRLPEARDEASMQALWNTAKAYNFSRFPAGVYFDQAHDTYRFLSDDAPIVLTKLYTNIHYGGAYQYWTKQLVSWIKWPNHRHLIIQFTMSLETRILK